MRAATAVKTITPVQGMQMAGFDRRSLPAEGILDDLQVCALALLDDRDGAFVFCVYDSLGTDSTFCAGVKQAVGALCGLAPQQVWVGATHTHAAPGAHFYGKKGYDAAFAQQMIQAGAETAALFHLDEVSRNGDDQEYGQQQVVNQEKDKAFHMLSTW